MSPGKGYYVYLTGENDIEFHFPIKALSKTDLIVSLQEELKARKPVHYPQIISTGISPAS